MKQKAVSKLRNAVTMSPLPAAMGHWMGGFTSAQR